MEALISRLREFVSDRDWDQFHSPKNLAMALGTEVGELIGEFQWLTEHQSQNLEPAQLDRVRREIADVAIYLVLLSLKVGVDPVEEALSKITENAAKYPAELVRGKASKSTEYTR